MTDRCPQTADLVARLAEAPAPDDPIWQHVGDCDTCARAIARRLLSSDAPDEDDHALAAAGFADEPTRRRVERALALDPRLTSPPAPPITRRAAPVLALAATALLAAAAWLWLRSDPIPPRGLIPRGPAAEADAELLIGDDRICHPAAPDAPPCDWQPAIEPLTLHYRAPRPIYALAYIHDAAGDTTRLHPDDGDPARVPACPDRFCLLTGSEYTVPAGSAEVIVILTDAAVEATVAPPATLPEGATRHRFLLRVR